MNMIKKMSRTAKYFFSIPLFLVVSFAVGFIFQSNAIDSLANALLGIGMMTAWMFFSNSGENISESMNFSKQDGINKLKIIFKNTVYLIIIIAVLMGSIVTLSLLLKLDVGYSLEITRPIIMFIVGIYTGLALQKHGLGGQIPAPE